MVCCGQNEATQDPGQKVSPSISPASWNFNIVHASCLDTELNIRPPVSIPIVKPIRETDNSNENGRENEDPNPDAPIKGPYEDAVILFVDA